MKKILLSIAIVLMIGLSASAQRGNGNDGFFLGWEDVNNGIELSRDPGFPGGHGGGDEPAPLGSGIAVLTALGVGYALKKRYTK